MNVERKMTQDNIISKTEFAKKYNSDEKILLIDVRSPAEFKGHHVSGSFNIPLEKISTQSVQNLLAEQDHPTDGAIYILCRSGMRAKLAEAKINTLSSEIVCIDQGLEGIKTDPSINFNYADSGVISLERQVRIGAGALVMLGIILGALIHPSAYALSGFVGLGLCFAGITDWCGMGLLLAKMPWNRV
jgi:rhodanese-related sulfurtransferase